MIYDYKERKDKIIEMLKNNCDIEEKDIPKDDDNFTYNNGVKCLVGSIFIDIVGSTNLINKQKDVVVAKLLRTFTSEIICILNSSNQSRQIGVRGDCVYGIFSVPSKDDIFELADLSFHINTFMTMFNKLLSRNNLPNISVGIGVAVGRDLVVKAGQKGTGINDRIWIGRSVVEACTLANKAGRNGRKTIAFNNIAYNNMIKKLRSNNSEKNVDSWFDVDDSVTPNIYYAGIIKSDFEKWINDEL